MDEASRGARLLAAGDAERQAGRSDAARRAFAGAIAAFQIEADLTGEARALACQAQLARDAGDLDWAQHDQQAAIALLRYAGDGPALAHALRHAGDMFREAGDLPHAASALEEAAALYAADPEASPLDRANAVRSVALLAEALGERIKAHLLWQDARERYAALDAEFRQAGVTGNPGVEEAEQHIASLG